MSAAHLHLLINHLPIVGGLLALALLLLALWRPAHLASAALVLMLSGVGAGAALLTGEPAEEQVEHLPGVSEALIHEHEERAELAALLSVAAGLAAAGALATQRWSRLPGFALPALLALSSASAGAMVWTGASGGVIRHSELQSTGAIVAGALDEGSDDDHSSDEGSDEDHESDEGSDDH